MRRRQAIGALGVGFLAACDALLRGGPDKVRLIPDGWHIINVGRLPDGRLFWVTGQLDPTRGATRDFTCTFLFDRDGRLVEHAIELVGVRGEYPEGAAERAEAQHLAALGEHTITDIWIRPFSVESHGKVFGLIPRFAGDAYRVEFMPGNTLSFYPPWENGEYDT